MYDITPSDSDDDSKARETLASAEKARFTQFSALVALRRTKEVQLELDAEGEPGRGNFLLDRDDWSTPLMYFPRYQNLEASVPDDISQPSEVVFVTGYAGSQPPKHYTGFHEAVAAVKDGGVVLVYPGEYNVHRETIVLDKPMRLEATRATRGSAEFALVQLSSQFGATIVHCKSNGIVMRGLEFVHQLMLDPEEFLEAGTSHLSALVIENCDTEVERCSVTSDAGNCMLVKGANARPTVRQCYLGLARESGLHVTDSAQGLFEDNRIFSCTASNVLVSSRANPTIRCNQVMHGKMHGLIVTGSGRGLFENNTITDHAGACVMVELESDPSFNGNTVARGGTTGILAVHSSQGTFTGNHISHCRAAAIAVAFEAHPMFRDNIITNNPGLGISVADTGYGVFENNKVHDNTGSSAVYIESLADPVFSKNIIVDNAGTGIFICDNGKGTFDGNELRGNLLAAVEVRRGGDPQMHGNFFRGTASGLGGQTALKVSQAGRGRWEGNLFEMVENTAVMVEDGGNPVVVDNVITSCGRNGVEVTDLGLGLFERNKVSKCQGSGFIVTREGSPVVRENVVFDNLCHGVQIADYGAGLFEGNDIFGNHGNGVSIETDSNPTISKLNVIHDGKTYGVSVDSFATGTIHGNKIIRNAQANMRVCSGANPSVRRNLISIGRNGGVVVDNNGAGRFERNKITNNSLINVHVGSGGIPVFRKNIIAEAFGHGLVVGPSGGGSFEGNRFIDNAGAGVCLERNSTASLLRNDIGSGNRRGVVLHGGARGVLEKNTMFGNIGEALEMEAQEGGPVTTKLISNQVTFRPPDSLGLHETPAAPDKDRRMRSRVMLGGGSDGGGGCEVQAAFLREGSPHSRLGTALMPSKSRNVSLKLPPLTRY